jgi:CheY-specific phosphatase CheX
VSDQPKEELRLDKKLADAMEKAIQQTLNDTFSLQTRMGSWSVDVGPISLDPYILCSINMKQDDISLGSFVLGFSHETIMKVLQAYGVEGGGDQQVIDDAAQELTNIIYGAIKTTVNKTGAQLSMDIPSSIHDKKNANERFSKLQKMILPFWTDGSRCNAIIAKTSH